MHAQVVSLPEYQAWMQGFPTGTLHILAAVNKGSAMLEGSATLQVVPFYSALHVPTCVPVASRCCPAWCHPVLPSSEVEACDPVESQQAVFRALAAHAS